MKYLILITLLLFPGIVMAQEQVIDSGTSQVGIPSQTTSSHGTAPQTAGISPQTSSAPQLSQKDQRKEQKEMQKEKRDAGLNAFEEGRPY